MATAPACAKGLSLAAVLTALAGPPASAADPDRPIRVVLGFPAGGGADIMARWFVEKLREISGTAVILENRPGASGNIAAEIVAKAKPDGYTLLMAASASMGGGRFLYKDLPFNSVTSFAPVTTVSQIGYVLAVNPKTQVKTVAELTRYLKAKNGNATYGWAATSSIASAVLYTSSENVPTTPVNYKAAGAALTDVAAGQVDFTFSDMAAVGRERPGKVKVLAVTTDRRAGGAPHVPTMVEAGVPGASAAPWWGLWAPAGTPQDVLDRLETWMNQVVALPETKEFLVSRSADPLPGGQKVMKDKLLASIESWRKVTAIVKIAPQ